MFRLDEELKVYLHRAPVDFRLNINGLAALVQHALGLDPFAACVYVFSNRRRDRVKILGWDRNGLQAAAQAAGAGPLHLAERGRGALPDMGRMTPILPWDARHSCSAAASSPASVPRW